MGGSTMTKKIGIRKIETSIPCDVFASSIDGIVGATKGVNLDVYFTSEKIYELEDTMFVILNMYDGTGEMKALLVGNRDKDFTSLVDSIQIDVDVRYRISGNVSIPADTEDAELSFMNELKDNKLFCIYALQRNPKSKYSEQKHLARTEIEKVRDGISIVQQSIVDSLKSDDKSISMEELHIMYCYDGDDGFDLDIHQFYDLYVSPLIKSKEIKVCNLSQCTKDKPLPMTQFELMYNGK